MKSHVDISSYSSMGIGGFVKDLLKLKTDEDVAVFGKKVGSDKTKFLILGEGTNIVFGEKLEYLTVAKMELKGIDVEKETKDQAIVSVRAGERWDEFVNFAVKKGFSGIEALSGIPGTVGASPVQNIGAYGSEVKDVILKVEVYDTEVKKFECFENEDCRFSYRDSIFKNNPNRWIITKVFFRLNKNLKISAPKYKDVENYFKERSNSSPTMNEIRKAIIKIRSLKLPNPSVIPNCGSFFKNPIIEKDHAEKIRKKFKDMPVFPHGKFTKIPAGYLIEKVGFKGKNIGRIKVYQNNALVLTNPIYASFSDLLFAKNEIQKTVFNKFGIHLESEVNIIV